MTILEYHTDVLLHALKEEQKEHIFNDNIQAYLDHEKVIKHIQDLLNGNHPLVDKYRDSFNEKVSL